MSENQPTSPEAPPSPARKSDCYSEGERGWMEFGQWLRAVVLGPLLSILTRAGVTPDMVTVLAGAVGVAFLPFWLLDRGGQALVLLWGHVLLDGLDGPLARHQGTASSRGSFTDTFTDQLVVTVAMVAWMITDRTSLGIAAGTLYVFLYALVVAMAMVRNALSVPYSWLVRPRFFVYAAISLDHFFLTSFTTLVLGICAVLLAVKSISGFLALRRHLPGPETP